MAGQIHEFRVSAKELVHLQKLALRDKLLAELVRGQEVPHGCGTILRLSRDAAEQLRDCLMSEMDISGFDENYHPNEQGQLIEALIDRFFLR